MGRTVRQKRKARSSRPVVNPGNRRKKQLNPQGNSLIAQNWDKNETLTQNYRRLGLLTRLQKSAGGTESALIRSKSTDPSSTTSLSSRKSRRSNHSSDPFAISNKVGRVREVRVERDSEGRIIRVLDQVANPLNDPLNELDSDSDEDGGAEEYEKGISGAQQHHPEEWGGFDDDEEDEEIPMGGPIVKQLEAQARRPVASKKRHQSEREMEWLQRLVDRHGDDYAAMARDMRLNPMQQTAGDLRRRVKRMSEAKM